MQGIRGWLRRGVSRQHKRTRGLDLIAARKRFLRQPVVEHLEAREAPGSAIHIWMGALLDLVTGGAGKRTQLSPQSGDDVPASTASSNSLGLPPDSIRSAPSQLFRLPSELARRAALARSIPITADDRAEQTESRSSDPAGVRDDLSLVFQTDALLGEDLPKAGGAGLDAEDFRKYGTDGGAGGDRAGSGNGGGGDGSHRQLPSATEARAADALNLPDPANAKSPTASPSQSGDNATGAFHSNNNSGGSPGQSAVGQEQGSSHSGNTGNTPNGAANPPATASQHPDRADVSLNRHGQYARLDAHGKTLREVKNIPATERPERNVALPYGVFSFTLEDLPIGGSATVDLTLPDDAQVDSYYKQDPQLGGWFRFDYDGQTGAVIDGNVVTLHLVDGGRGDADGLANGVIVDPGGPGAGVVYLVCSPNGLTDWTVSESGGTAAGKGTVASEGEYLVLREGNSFITLMERDFTIPADTTILTFDYAGTFDTSDPAFINDAFEVAFVDAAGKSLVPTIRHQRDSFFNLSEEVAAGLGEWVTHYPNPSEPGTNALAVSGTVDLDVSQLAAGTQGKVVVRLVNDDSSRLAQDKDVGTVFRLHCPQVPTAGNDSFSTNEDTPLNVSAASGVLDNDDDPSGQTLTAVLVTAPAHGTLTLNSDGSFGYTPDANYIGVDTFTYKASNGTQQSIAATVTITVNPINDPPTAVADSHSTSEDTALTISSPGVLANDTDAENDPLTAVLVTGPASGTLTLNSNGSFTYTPNANFHGTDSFTYKANDGAADSAAATVTINVTAVPDRPVAANDSHETSEDTPLTISAPGVLGNDTDADGDSLTAILVGGPSHGTLTLNADGSFSYTPAANYNGPDSFTYKASDGALESLVPATVSIEVIAVPDPPVANGDEYSTTEDVPLTVTTYSEGVLDNDTDPDGGALTAVLVAGPSNGTLTLNSNGSFTYTPDANFNGTDNFTYKAYDGALHSLSPATVTIHVDAEPDRPTASDDSYSTDEDTLLDVMGPGVLENDSDPDFDMLSAILVSGPSHGTLSLSSDGSFTYTPAANYTGEDSFIYKANDGEFDSVPAAKVTIFVNPVGDPPVANGDSYQTNEDVPLVVGGIGVLANDTDIDSTTLSAILDQGPSSGTLTLNANGSFTYTPDPNFFGTDSFSYYAFDGALQSEFPATVTIQVISVNDAASVVVPSKSASEGQTVNLSATFTDPESNQTHTAVIDWGDGATSVGVVSESAGSGTVTGSHVYADNGSYTITVSVTDNGTPAATGSSTSTATIGNVAPALTSGYSFTAVGTGDNEELGVLVSGRFTDPGFSREAASTVESWTVTINWGDGSPVQTVAAQVTQGSEGALSSGVFSQTHVYAQAGLYTATVTATDDDLGSDSDVFNFGIVNMTIDVKPTLNLKSNGRIPVHVDASDNAGIDLSLIDPDTVRFGPAGAQPTHWQVIGSGDIRSNFETFDSGIRPTDTVAYMTGKFISGLIFVGLDRIRIAPGSEQGPNGVTPPEPNPPGASKFFVANAGDQKIYRYLSDGTDNGTIALDTAAKDVRDITLWDDTPSDFSDALLWAIGGTQQVALQQADGIPLGSWRAFEVENPQGIATYGKDIWIVDAGTLKVHQYVELARNHSFFGVGVPALSFSLAAANANPTGITTDGNYLWVVDDPPELPGNDPVEKVFVYTLAGDLDGSWEIDVNNDNPTGITRSLTDSSIMWIVDREDRKIYKYAGAKAWRDGVRSATPNPLSLVSANTNAVGIADPGPNYPPVAMDDMYQNVTASTPTNLMVRSNDSDPNGDPITIISVTTPTNGTATIASGGTHVIFTGNAGYSSSSFQYTISDGQGGTDTATVSVFAPQNWPPLAGDDLIYGVSTTTATTIYPLDNDSDPENGTLTIVSITQPAHGTANINAGGTSITFTPSESFVSDGFQYTIQDPGGQTDTATIALFNNQNAPPQAMADVRYGIPLVGATEIDVLVNDFDLNGDALTITSITTPSNGTASITSNGKQVSFTPGSGFSSTSLQYTISDGHGHTATSTLTIQNWSYSQTYDVPQYYSWYFGHADEPSIDSDPTALSIAEAMSANPSVVTGASFVSRPSVARSAAVSTAAVGRFGAADGSQAYGVLSTGEAAFVNDPGELTSFNLEGGAIRGDTDRDVTILKIDLNVPSGVNYLSFDFQFLTEEFPIFIDPKFNDAFIAELDNSTWSTSGGVISAPNNFAVLPGNAPVSITGLGYERLDRVRGEESAFDGGATGSAGDSSGAATNLLRARTPITPGAHSLYLSIFDQGDAVQDSTVLIRNLQFGNASTSVTPGVADVLEVDGWTVKNPFDAYSDVLINGQVSGDFEGLAVTVNGQPVQSIDVRGRYFLPVQAMPGMNTFLVEARNGAAEVAVKEITFEAVVRDESQVQYEILRDASASIVGQYAQTSFHEQPDVVYADIAIRNDGTYLIDAPLLVGVINISEPSVRIRDIDGITRDGIPFFNFTELLDHGAPSADATLSPGETTEQTTISFYNPDRLQFTYDLVVLGRLNKPPRFVTAPVVKGAVGKLYAYDSDAYDENQDVPLAYRAIAAPAGMTIDQATGAINWTPSTGQAGNHSVILEVADGRGGTDVQEFVLSVSDAIPNRPPLWTSTPVTEAYVNIQYRYPGAAVDPDNNAVQYSLVSGPTGLSIDPATGFASWVPTADQVGQYHDVVLKVEDLPAQEYDLQSYQIFVMQQPGNHPPIIVSEPSTYFEVAGERSPTTGNVDPTLIDLELADGASQTIPVSITLPGTFDADWPYADIIFMVDESISMADGDQNWIGQMAVELDVLLVAAGIGPNRYGLVGFGSFSHDPLEAAHRHDVGPADADPMFGTASELNNAAASLISDGGTEDGYDAIDEALDYPFRPSAATNLILITDEDRDSIASLTKQQVLEDILSNAARLNVVVGAEFDDSNPNTTCEVEWPPPPEPPSEPQEGLGCVLGVDASGNAYLPDGNGGFIVTTGGVVLPPASQPPPPEPNDTNEDYVELAWDTDGAAWSLWLLREGGDLSTSFTNAIVGLKNDEIVADVDYDINLIASDPSVDFENLTGVIQNASVGIPLTFQAKFTGDGFRHAFDLWFVRQSTGEIVASIPVNLDSDWSYDVDAVDPDDDPITYSLLEGPADASIDLVTGLIDWIPLEAGEFAFSVQAADPRGGIDVQDFVVTVTMGEPNSAPTITSIAPTQAAVNRTYSYQVEANDPDGDFLTFFLSFPDPQNPLQGIQIDQQTGLVTWTPIESQIGSRTYRVHAIDGRGGQAVPQEVTVAVSASLPNTAPQITSTAPTSAVVGETYKYVATAFDAEADVLTFDLPVRPIGMTIDPAARTIVWTPSPDQVGRSFDAILRVRDPFGGIDLEPFKIKVDAENSPPVFISVPPAGPAAVGSSLEYCAQAVDPNGDAVRYTLDATSLAKGLAVGLTTGMLAWQPNSTHTGTHTIVITADDQRGGITTQSFTIGVADPMPNTLPQITTSSLPTPAAAAKPYQTKIAATDADGERLRYFIDSAPLGVQIDPVSGVLAWTPTSDQVSQTPHEIVVSVLDTRGARIPKTFTVTVEASPSNQSPVITPTALLGPAAPNVAYRDQIVASDPNADRLNYSVDATSAGKGIKISSSGLLTWTPTSGHSGTHTIVVTVDDGRGLSDSESFLIEVNAGGNQSPSITTTSLPGPAATGVPYQATVKATDPNGDPITFSFETIPPNVPPMGVTIDSSGLITWANPVPKSDGSPYVFTVKAFDGRQGSGTAQFSLDVENFAVNVPPEVTSEPRTRVRAGQTWVYSIACHDANGDALEYSLADDVDGVPLPAGMTLIEQGCSHALRWETANVPLGTYPIVLRAEEGPDPNDSYDLQLIHIEVVSQNANADPTITSNPPSLNATLDVEYAYDLTAHDPDSDPLAWKLVEGPAGMFVDSLSGKLRWTPAEDQLGPQKVVIRVSDPYGGNDEETFTLNVRAANLAPYYTSVPLTSTLVLAPYIHPVGAVDPEGASLTFTVFGTDSANPPNTISPLALTIDQTGVISWHPLEAGSFHIVVTATDPLGASNDYRYTLDVSENENPPVDRAPYFTTVPLPPLEASVDEERRLLFTAVDPDVDILSYSLAEIPAYNSATMPPEAEMQIDAETGLVTWTPDAEHLAGTALHFFTVLATANGKTASVRYQILVRPANNAPVITSEPTTLLIAGQTYRYDVQVEDPDLDPISYALQLKPAGMEIDSFGRITWSPTVADIGEHPVEILVSDGRNSKNSEAVQTFTITVRADTTAPKVDLRVAPNPVRVGKEATILVSTLDDVGIESVVLTVGGQNLSLDSRGLASFVTQTPGNYAVVATVKDAAGNSAEATATLTVISGAGAPLVAITAPDKDGTQGTNDDGAIITAPTAVIGSVSDASTPSDLASYKLELFTVSGQFIKTIASDSSTSGPLADFSGTFGTLDPTLLENGPYLLRLSATDLAGTSTTLDRLVHVDGRLKLGNFTLGFTDLTIPVAGIPITITRTYDTSRAGDQGDFGYGWQLGFGSVDVKVEFPDGPMAGWGALPAFRDGTRVLITKEDGTTEGFTFQPWEEKKPLGLPSVWHPRFVADPGVNSFLAVPDAELSLQSGEYVSYEGGGLTSYNPADPLFGNAYTLHTLDGLARRIKASTGELLTMSDTHGNTLAFTDDAIRSNRGRQVQIDRDSAGRITRITDPRGNYLSYEYDVAGNLVAVTDRTGLATSHFAYRSDPKHFLESMTDPYGRQKFFANYTADNRLGSVTDAHGFLTSYSYDLENLSATILDPEQKSLTQHFDARGNVLKEVNQEGETTLRQFNASDLTTAETVVIGQPDSPSNGETNDLTTTYEYNGGDTLKSMTDPLGEVTRIAYDDAGQPTSITDPLGNSVQFIYAYPLTSRPRSGYVPPADLRAIVQPESGTRYFEYDAQGNMKAYTADVTFNNFVWYDMMTGGYDSQNYSPYCTYTDDACQPLSRPHHGKATFAYNESGDLIGSTDFSQVSTTIPRDENGNRRGTSYSWVDPADPNNVQSVVITHEFDAEDRATETTSPDGTEVLTYDLLGQTTQASKPTTSTSTVYDARGAAIESTLADGAFSRNVYDSLGRVVWSTDPQFPGRPTNGTRTIYDGLGRETGQERYENVVINLVEQPDGSLKSVFGSSSATPLWTTTTLYNDDGTVQSTTNAEGLTTTYEYDKSGRQTGTIQVVSGIEIRTETTFDAAGNVIATRDALGRVTRFELDGSGRPATTKFPDGNEESRTFNHRGAVTSSTDALGRLTSYVYATNGQLTSVELPEVFDPISNSLQTPLYQYTYDDYNHLSTIVDPYNRVEQREYDSQGRLSRREMAAVAGAPDSIERRTYDDLGRLETIIDAKGQVTAHAYDSLGRVSDTRYFASEAAYQANQPTETVAYDYDLFDAQGVRHNTVTDASGVTDTAYDLEGRIVSIVSPEGTVNYEYSPQSGRVTRVHTSQTDIRYDYDVRGLLTTVTVVKREGVVLATPEVTNYTCDLAGNVTTVTRPNGIISHYSYDERNRPKYIEHLSPAGALLDSYYYVRDAVGKVVGVYNDRTQTAVEQALAAGQAGTFSRSEYEYDALDRIFAEMHYEESAASPNVAAQYEWDLVSNLLEKTVSKTGQPTESSVFQYNDRNQIIDEVFALDGVTQWTTAYQYDANGSVLHKERPNEITDFVYDLRNRLSAATTQSTSGGQTTTVSSAFTYDDQGIRTRSQVTTQITGQSPVTETSFFLNDPLSPSGYSQVLEEWTGGGVLKATFVHGKEPISQTRAGVTSFYLLDGHSGVRRLTNATGAITDSDQYLAFGDPLSASGTTVNPLQYRGQWLDNNLGQYYLRARFYDPATARFHRVDPWEGTVGRPVTLHRYLYADGEPIQRWDPTGEWTLPSTLVAMGIHVGAHAIKTKADLDAGKRVIGGHLGRIAMWLMQVNLMVAEVEEQSLRTWLAPADPYNRTLALGCLTNGPHYFSSRRRQKIFIKFAITSVALNAANYFAHSIPGFPPLPVKSNGMPNFSSVPGLHWPFSTRYFPLTGYRTSDFRIADRLLAIPRPPFYTWHHHEVVGIMILVPTPVHALFRHAGGAMFWGIAHGRRYR